MSFNKQDIRSLRQRLGWSLAEMARQMGCTASLIGKWETGASEPDSESLNQLRYLRNHVETYSEQIRELPQLEKEMESRRVAQLTGRDLLKDN